jgi:hypothetical protein
MNPYDFVRIDWNRKPERHCPVWHHHLAEQNSNPLYSGHLEVDVYAETPIFIPAWVDESKPLDPQKPAQFMCNGQGEYIIPGSSLKGMLRNVLESLGRGCLTLFDGQYERGQVNYRPNVSRDFQRCEDNTNLCITCRTFGMLSRESVFLGKVNISDAVVYPDRVYEYEKAIYTKPLMEPKPHHASFYLDPSGRHIAGRKFYFHHSREFEPLTADRLIYMGGRPANRYIKPLDYDTGFHFRVDFTALEEDELGGLLLAIVLEENMRHKIGNAKPLGLGSVQLIPTSMTLINFAARYAQHRPDRGKTTLEGDAMRETINAHVHLFSTNNHLAQIALEDLRRIWRWPPDPDADYYYPSKREWFDTPASRGKRIADTRNVPRQV